MYEDIKDLKRTMQMNGRILSTRAKGQLPISHKDPTGELYAFFTNDGRIFLRSYKGWSSSTRIKEIDSRLLIKYYNIGLIKHLELY